MGRSGHVVILRLAVGNVPALSRLDTDGAEGGLHRLPTRGEEVLIPPPGTQAVGGRLTEHSPGQLILTGRVAQHRNHMAGTAFLHHAGSGVHVQRPLLQQPGAGVGQGLGGHVVHVAHQLGNLAVGGVRRLAPEGPDAVGPFKLLLAHAVANATGGHDGHGAELPGKVGHQSGAGGGAQLALHLAAVGGHALQQEGGGGGGYRHHSVGAPDKAAAHVDRRGHNFVGSEQIHGIAHAHHVGHRVQGAHLVEVDLIHRAAVGLGLSGGDGVVHRLSMDLYLPRQGQAADERSDMAGRGMVMVVMAMLMLVMVLMAMVVAGTVGILRVAVVLIAALVMLMGMDVDMPLSGGHGHVVGFLLLTAYGHLHPGARNAAGLGGQGGKGDPGQAQGIHGADKGRLVGQQLVEGGHEHVACGAHIALQVQNLHGWEASLCCSWEGRPSI